jgi:hypothetical protein
LEKHLAYDATLFPLGVRKEYLKAVVEVPMCRGCGRTWPARQRFRMLVGCSMLLVLALVGVAVLATGSHALWITAGGIAAGAAAVGGLLKLHEVHLRPGPEKLRPPTDYPTVRDLRNKGYRSQTTGCPPSPAPLNSPRHAIPRRPQRRITGAR